MGFSLRALLLFCVGCGLGMAGLRYPSEIVAGLFSAAWMLVLLYGILNVVLRRGEARAYWIGFALFGCGYAGLVVHGMAQTENEAHFFPAAILRWIHDAEFPKEEYFHPHLVNYASSSFMVSREAMLDGYSYIGYTMMGIWIAMLGGVAGLWISRQNKVAAELAR